jgi:hypothetical protein
VNECEADLGLLGNHSSSKPIENTDAQEAYMQEAYIASRLGLTNLQAPFLWASSPTVNSKGMVLAEFATLVNPERTDTGATWLHHISARAVQSAPRLESMRGAAIAVQLVTAAELKELRAAAKALGLPSYFGDLTITRAAAHLGPLHETLLINNQRSEFRLSSPSPITHMVQKPSGMWIERSGISRALNFISTDHSRLTNPKSAVLRSPSE